MRPLAIGRWVLATAAVLGLGACELTSEVDAETKRTVQDVVRQNLTALEQGDGRAVCRTYTPRYLETYRDSYECVSKSAGRPNRSAPMPDIRFGDVVEPIDTENEVSVSFTVDGGSDQSYNLRFTEPPPEVGGGKRWLIDLESVARE